MRIIAITAALIVACISGGRSIGEDRAAPITDVPFYQDYHESYPLATTEENDVRALALDGDERLWAATADGVRMLENGKWTAPPGGKELGPTHCLYRDSRGTIWAGAWNGLFRVAVNGVEKTDLGGSPISAICAIPAAEGGSTDTVFAAGPTGIRRLANGRWTIVDGSWQTVIRAILPGPDHRLWIATASGLYLQGLENGRNTLALNRPKVLLSSNVHAFAALPGGEIAIGSTGGVDVYRGAMRIRSYSGLNGMPAHQVRGLATDGSGRLWAATDLGVARLDHGAWSLRHSRRWLQSDDTRAVVIDRDGTAWVATSAGVDAIRRRTMTLASKADYFLKMLRARHIRPPGLVGPAVLSAPGDLSHSFIEDDDNDGEHTGMYCAMESMRYAVTKDPSARDNARAAFHALLVLQQATGTGHFIARSVLPIGTPPRHEVDRTFTPQEIAESRRTDPRAKIIEKRWLPTTDGKWLWKRDASSDEVDGHMFGYTTYYDLAADESERKLVAEQVDRIVGGIVDHGYVLQDIDGKGTQWGDWSPESLNGNANWHEERAGNSIEILAYLGTAYRMTGKEKYSEAARTLIEKHGYVQNMLGTVFDTPSERTHIEDELLSMVYPTLMTNLIVPSLKSAGQASMQSWHKSAGRDGIPFYDFAYNRFSGRRVNLDRAAETLRDWPLDHIEWTVDNSKRDDVVRDLTPGLDEGRLTRILPRSEMGLCMWDQEPYKAVIGNGGAREDKPTDWLLAYWMGRYYGLLGK